MTITERIFIELSQKNISQKDFSRDVNINEKTVSAWKRNNSLPPADKISEISDYLGVSSDYLLTGKEKNSSQSELTERERECLSVFNNLKSDDQLRYIGRMEATAEMYEEQADALPEEQPAVRTITLSCSENRVSAGFGDELFDYEQWDTINVIETPISRKADFILVVDGDSMMPKFSDGDHVLIRQQPAVDIGQIGIFYINGKGYIKKFEGDHLVSLNPQYEDILLEDTDFKCFGLVLGVAELA